MSSKPSDPSNHYFRFPDVTNQRLSSELNDSDVDSRFSISSRLSTSSQRSPRIHSSRRSSVAIPPRYSVCQGEFFRVRSTEKPLYPSYCYAIPETSALKNVQSVGKSYPIQFIGLDIAEFYDSEPTTTLHFKGEQSCDESQTQRRRSSIVMVENAETQRNDEILSRLEESDSESDSDDFIGRRSISTPSTSIKKKSLKSIPVSNLRNYLKRAEELEQVNANYRAMCKRLQEQRQQRLLEEMEVEEDSSAILRTSIVPGQMDTLIQYNNALNRRLSNCSDSQMMDASYENDHLRSPRLCKIASETAESLPNMPVDSQLLNISSTEYLIQQLEERMEMLPSLEDIGEVVERGHEILESAPRVLELTRYVQESWEKNEQIDVAQAQFNEEESRFNLSSIQFEIEKTGSLECLKEIESDTWEYILFHSKLLGWEVSFSDKCDFLLKFPFHSGFFFLKISRSNGIIFNVKKSTETIRDEDLQTMFYKLKTVQSIKNEYRCYELCDLLRNLSNDLIRIRQAWEEQHY